MKSLFLKRSDSWDVRRFGVLALAVLQLGVAGTQVADAILEADQTALPTHVESQQGEECDVRHDHLFCQVVRSLTALARSHDVAAAPMAFAMVERGLAIVGQHPPAARLPDGSARPRAPPVA
ncbi:MAG: hypothetical protein R3253_05150 [Longimicrobiales bacterium]|nr:hypothetical protein [Longimicrobiales bacterium]